MLKLFTWLTNLGALGVLVLMAVTSFAVVAFFRAPAGRPTRGRGARSIAPLVAGVLMLVILVLGVTNFNVLITGSTDAPTDTMAVVLPLILLGAAVAGMRRPPRSSGRASRSATRQIGERTAVEQAEHVA